MKSAISFIAAASVLLPTAAGAQEFDVTRRSFTFIESRLEVAVVSGIPGELQVVRGELGRVDVAARTQQGFAHFGLGGAPGRQLRLTATGAERANYVVVVPERVAVRIVLPDGSSADLPPSAASGTWRWPAVAEVRGRDGSLALPVSPAIGRTGAAPSTVLPLVHRSAWVPDVIDVPDLAAVRSMAVRVEGDEFRVAASRPLYLEPGSHSRMELRLAGEPVDLVFYVPAQATLALVSGSTRIAESANGRAQPLCGNVAVLGGPQDQRWLSFHPQGGRLDCR